MESAEPYHGPFTLNVVVAVRRQVHKAILNDFKKILRARELSKHLFSLESHPICLQIRSQHPEVT